MPHSLPVLLTLPAEKLADAMVKQPELKDELICYAATHLNSIPPDVVQVLGLADE